MITAEFPKIIMANAIGPINAAANRNHIYNDFNMSFSFSNYVLKSYNQVWNPQLKVLQLQPLIYLHKNMKRKIQK